MDDTPNALFRISQVPMLEDRQGYILHHRVMQQETDNQIALEMVREAQRKYPQLTACSFDKGFHSPENQLELAKRLDQVILPKKGAAIKRRTRGKVARNSEIAKRSTQPWSPVLMHWKFMVWTGALIMD